MKNKNDLKQVVKFQGEFENYCEYIYTKNN